MAAALPFISALAPILAPILGSFFAPKPDVPQLAPPPVAPQVTPEATVAPEGVLDREAARSRSIQRRKAASQKGGLLELASDKEGTSGKSVKRKTLLGQ